MDVRPKIHPPKIRVIVPTILSMAFLVGGAPVTPKIPDHLCADALTKSNLETFVPLGNGTLPKDLDANLLYSFRELKRFLATADYPWKTELEAVTERDLDNTHLIYLSEIGPTLWDIGEFGEWAKAVASGLASDPQLARKAILQMANGTKVAGYTNEAATRVRNSFLARMESERDDEQMSHIIREESPSLLLPFERDVQAPRRRNVTPLAEEDFQNIRRNQDAIWISRTLLRSALIRHKLSQGQSLDDLISEDDIFTLAAFPELSLIWKEVARWNFPIRHHNLSVRLGEFHSPYLDVNNGTGDLASLSISRSVSSMKERPFTEKPAIQISLTTKYSAANDNAVIDTRSQRRLILWFSKHWKKFEEAYRPLPYPTPKLRLDAHNSTLQTDWEDPRQAIALIAFFGYLSERYPTYDHH